MLVVVVATAIAVLWQVHGYDPGFLKIDACLDRGGSWDFIGLEVVPIVKRPAVLRVPLLQG